MMLLLIRLLILLFVSIYVFQAYADPIVGDKNWGDKQTKQSKSPTVSVQSKPKPKPMNTEHQSKAKGHR